MSEMLAMPNTDVNIPESQDREHRQRVLKKGVISYSEGHISIECVVRDLSSGGVRLHFPVSTPVPDNFDLSIPMDGLTAQCLCRWRKGQVIGATFVGEPTICAAKGQPQLSASAETTVRRSVLRKPKY